MSTITADHRVRIAPGRAAERLQGALERIAPDRRLALRVPARDLGIPAELALEHDVALRFSTTRDRTGLAVSRERARA